MNALQEDIEAEGNRQPLTITIYKYDKNKLRLFISELQSNVPRYQLAKYNCSNVVAECLHTACNQKASFYPTAHDYGRLGKVLGRGIWTPFEVLRYARELKTHEKS